MKDGDNTVVWLHDHITQRRPDLTDIRVTRAAAEYEDLDTVAALGETAMKAIHDLQKIVELQTGSANDVAHAILEAVHKMTDPLPDSPSNVE